MFSSNYPNIVWILIGVAEKCFLAAYWTLYAATEITWHFLCTLEAHRSMTAFGEDCILGIRHTDDTLVNNAHPVHPGGMCCGTCNVTVVLPARRWVQELADLN